MRAQTTRTINAPRAALLALIASMLCAGLLPTGSASAAGACPNEARRAEQGSTYLPDCRGYELASPQLKNGQEVEPAPIVATQIPFQAALEGPAVAYLTTGAFPGSESGGLYDQYLARGGAPGSSWQNTSLNPETRFATFERYGPASTGEFRYYSPNLTCGVEETELPQALHPGESAPQPLPVGENPGEVKGEPVKNLYLWTADGTQQLITSLPPSNTADQKVSQENTGYPVDGVSSGCGKVLFEGALSEEANNFLGAPPHSMYVWNAATKTLEVASVLPNGTDASSVIGSEAGEKGSNVHQFSEDGSKAFFTAVADSGADAGRQEIFMREHPGEAGASTKELSAPDGGSATADTGATFQAASADGSRVFFTANYGLAGTGSTGAAECALTTGTGCDLYEEDTETGVLTDLSADTSDANGANVRSVLGTSEDGSVVYFSAGGQLVAGKGNSQKYDEIERKDCSTLEEPKKAQCETQDTAERARCAALTEYQSEHARCEAAWTNGEVKPREANVYAYSGGSLTYVSTIGAIEAGEAVGKETERGIDALAPREGRGIKNLVARVSPDGNYLLFATRVPVKEEYEGNEGYEYDNEDKLIAKQRDYEEYEYSLSASSIHCASCNPNRAERPTEEPTTPFGPKGPFTEARDGAPARTLLSDGRVFFDSDSALFSQVTDGTVNAFEWAPEGAGDCPSGESAGCTGLLDSGTDPSASYVEGASADGENVYVTTDAKLAPQDPDGLRDIYDVRVGGGIEASSTSHCSGEECQGPVNPGQVGSTSHASESGVGGGEPALATVIPGGPGKGVQGFTTHSVSVARSVKGTSVSVRIATPGAGKLTISGSGLTTAKVSAAKAGDYTLRVSLTAKEKKLLKHKKHLKLTLHIVYAPTSGGSAAMNTAVTFT